eukprot:g209.t1
MSPHLASVMCVGVGALWHVFRGPGALTLSARALSTGPNSVLLKQSEVIASPGPHKATVIWMHGLGDSSDGFSGHCVCVQPCLTVPTAFLATPI